MGPEGPGATAAAAFRTNDVTMGREPPVSSNVSSFRLFCFVFFWEVLGEFWMHESLINPGTT